MLVSGLVDNRSIIHLDLSCNRIGDKGARAISKLLESRSVLNRLDLNDNMIHAEGGKALARSLPNAPSLMSLNLSLNSIGDSGVRAICHVLQKATNVRNLNLAANGATESSISEITSLIGSNRTILKIDLSSNEFGNGEITKEIAEVLTTAYSEGVSMIRSLDVRSCGMDPEEIYKIEDLIRGKTEDAILAKITQQDEVK